MPLSFVLFAGVCGLALTGWVAGRVYAVTQRRRTLAAGHADLPPAVVVRDER